MAVKLFTIGSFFGLVMAIIIFPVLYIITRYSYGYFEKFFAWILILVLLFMIFRDNKRLWAIAIVFLSGLFGIIVFSIELKDPLFPMLSGLFGISTLIISYFDNNNIPEQKMLDETIIDKKQTFLSLIAGNLGSFIVSTFPGLSSSIAAVLSMQFVKDLGDKGFMILMGCIGTSSFVLSLVALYAVDKARNGAVIVVAQLIKIDIWTILIFLCAALIAGAFAVILSLYFGRIFCKIISKINYKMLIVSIIFIVTSLVIIMTSWLGLLVLITSTAIGIIPGIVKVQRTHSMACIMIPVILYLI
jgi:putative membrane protein